MIIHLDMDAFFASVEQMDNPDLRGKPVIIGGGDRGVVATASYEARVYGIHSAMPIARARQLCPHAIFIRGRHGRYSEISARVMGVLQKFSPITQKASIDEAYLDASGLGHLWKTHLQLARAIKLKISDATGGLTCSIGIAPVKFLAKICSDINKPDGIFILPPEKVDAFLEGLEVTRLPGVGRSMAASLMEMGITRVTQLRRVSREFLINRYGKWGAVLHDRAHGIDGRSVHENPPPKSESSEITFERDISDRKILVHTLHAHAHRIARALRKSGLAGRTITVKIKFANFQQITRSRTVESRINSGLAIFETASEILSVTPLPYPVRLLGICVSGFAPRPERLFLPGLAPGRYKGCEPDKVRAERLLHMDELADRICEKYGRSIVPNPFDRVYNDVKNNMGIE